MNYTEHEDAETFLSVVQTTLERHESINGLMLGVGLRLISEPNVYGSQPYLATVETAGGLSVAALMTPPHKLQIYSKNDYDIAGFELLAEALMRGKWHVPGVIARNTVAATFAAVWSRKAGVCCRTGMRQGLYELRQVVHPSYPAGVFKQAAVEDIELVRRWAGEFHDSCFGDDRCEQSIEEAESKVKKGALFFWVDGERMSMAARSRPTTHGEAISFVYTPPGQRGRGYATSVVARLSQRILDDGKQFCTLFTDMSNATSNSIYRRIGYKKVAEIAEVYFYNDTDNHRCRI